MAKHLKVIGDSHVRIFEDIPDVHPYHLGPVLVNSLTRENTTHKGRERLFHIVSRSNPDKCDIMLVFGEIDIRCHVTKQAKKQNLHYKKIIGRLIDNYISITRHIARKGFKVYIWNVIPTYMLPTDSVESFPAGDSLDLRNRYTSYFNNLMRGKCIPTRNVSFLKQGFDITNYHLDKIHLHPNAKKIILTKLKQSKLTWSKERNDCLRNIDATYNNINYLTRETANEPLLSEEELKQAKSEIRREK